MEVLRQESRKTPDWLAAYKPGDAFPLRKFLQSRVVYYPGAGDDGHPLPIFGGAHAAHCFVFADYWTQPDHIRMLLHQERHPYHPRGYRAMWVCDVAVDSIIRPKTANHLREMDLGRFCGKDPWRMAESTRLNPYFIGTVLERTMAFDDSHGPERLAILFAGYEAVLAFDALFCQEGSIAPYGVVLQDHGLGGNWTVFGGDESPMWQLASRFGQPPWLLVGSNTTPWPGYQLICEAGRAGLHNNLRNLYRKSPQP